MLCSTMRGYSFQLFLVTVLISHTRVSMGDLIHIHNCQPPDIPIGCLSNEYIDIVSAYAGFSHNWVANSCTNIDYNHCVRNLTSVFTTCNAENTCTLKGNLATQMDLYDIGNCPGPGNFLHVSYRCIPGTRLIDMCASDSQTYMNLQSPLYLANPNFPNGNLDPYKCLCTIQVGNGNNGKRFKTVIRTIDVNLRVSMNEPRCTEKVGISFGGVNLTTILMCSGDTSSNPSQNKELINQELPSSEDIQIGYVRSSNGRLNRGRVLLELTSTARLSVMCGQYHIIANMTLPPPTETTTDAVKLSTTSPFTPSPSLSSSSITGTSVVSKVEVTSSPTEVTPTTHDSTLSRDASQQIPDKSSIGALIGPIVGGILGFIVVVILLALAVCWNIRKRGTPDEKEENPFYDGAEEPSKKKSPSKTSKGPTGFINQTYQSPSDPDVIPISTPASKSGHTPQYEDIDLVSRNNYYNIKTPAHTTDNVPNTSSNQEHSPDYDVIREDSVNTQRNNHLPGGDGLVTYNYDTLPHGRLRYPNYETIPDGGLNYSLLSDTTSAPSRDTSSDARRGEMPAYPAVDQHTTSGEADTADGAADRSGGDNDEGDYDLLKDEGDDDTELVDNVIYD